MIVYKAVFNNSCETSEKHGTMSQIEKQMHVLIKLMIDNLSFYCGTKKGQSHSFCIVLHMIMISYSAWNWRL